VKHGLLAARLRFENAEQKKEFGNLQEALETDYEARNKTEEILVEEMAVSLWRVAMANAWFAQEYQHRRGSAERIIAAPASRCDEGQIPLFPPKPDAPSMEQLGLDCGELIVHSGTSLSEHEDPDSLSERSGKIGHLVLEAKLVSSAETVLRYQASP
jgi:hypothetical protein